MDRLANVCSLCGATRLDPSSSKQAWCRSCGGSGFELTDAGNELRKFVLALLCDPEVKTEFVDFVRAVKRDVGDSGE
jgi:hypothetical protein